MYVNVELILDKDVCQRYHYKNLRFRIEVFYEKFFNINVCPECHTPINTERSVLLIR